MLRFRTVVLLCVLGLAASIRAESSSPNVLLIISDDLRNSLGCYGNRVSRTPHLDRLASEGIRFDRAFSQYPVCGPSRASLMSGLYPNRTQVLKNDYTLGSYRVLNPSLAEHPSIGGFLRGHGYHSSRVSKIYHMGIPGGIERGEPGGDEPDSWDYTYDVLAPETHSPGVLELLSPKREHYGSNFARVIVPNGREATQADVMAAAQAVAILENRVGAEPDRPFFLAVGFVRPHVPLVAPKRLFDLYPEAAMELPFVPADDLADVPEPGRGMENWGRYGMNRLQQQQSIAGYYASVSFMDEQVGKLLSALDRLDLRKNTVVIFTSDHGYNLGEHECWQKLSLFEDSVRVPLIISAPSFADSAGKASDALVELIDIYPTVADLVGLNEETPSILQGRSLLPLLRQPGLSDWGRTAAYTVTYRNGESIRTDRWRYSKWGPDQGEELYDHENDPGEFTNLVNDGKHDDVLAEMRQLLEATRARSLE